MPVLPTLVASLLALLLGAVGVPARSASAPTDTLSPGQVLAAADKLVSNNSKFTLGFFRAPDGTAESSSSSPGVPPPDRWYLGIWFTVVPNRTTVWMANGSNPITNTGSPELRVSDDGDLVVVDQATNSQTWSARSGSANITPTNTTTAVLLNSGNLVLLAAASNSSSPSPLWQSFDHPTDMLRPPAKLGRDKLTGLNRRLVSKQSSATPSPGPYSYEVDPTAPQIVMHLCNSSLSTAYWTTGPWNGKFFSNIPELSGNVPTFKLAFVDNEQEEYLQYNVTDEGTVTRNFLDVTGQNVHQVWLGASRGWLTLFTSPKSQCDVYASCGPFSACGYSSQPVCSCMKGFSVKSQEDWDQGDQRGGCVRDAPLDCSSAGSNGTTRAATSSTDEFFSIQNIGLPDGAQRVQNVKSSDNCSVVCLNNCSCSAYSYGSQQGCLVWLDGLLNVKQPPSNGSGTLHLRLSAKEMHQGSSGSNKRGLVIGLVTGTCAALGLLVLATVLIICRRKKTKNIKNGGGGALMAFTYRELRSATKNFSDKLGQGGFGSVFKGQLRDSTAVAVKRLDGSFQGDKQFRAEVSSIGVIQHVNLVKLVGFCCEGNSRFLVYEHMPNRSLDIHLFQSTGTFLDWATRYQIAIGVARGLAYLHESCHERIIHCDVKPQNILLDAAFLPKLADFGMAKFVGRDFSRVLTTMRGTKGYLAPEWISGTAVTPKVDVYSYGMVLLELVSGKRNSDEEYTTSDNGEHVVYFPMKVARELLKQGDVRTLLDEKLCGDANLKEVERACKVACWCIQEDEDDRPTMGEVVQILEGVLDRDMPPLPRLLETIFGRPQSLRSDK